MSEKRFKSLRSGRKIVVPGGASRQTSRTRALSIACFMGLLLICIQAFSFTITEGEAAQEEPPARPLESGTPVERKLAAGESHFYQLTIAAGQYVKLLVEQRGIDLQVQFSGPDSKDVINFDSEPRDRGTELVEYVAESAGSCRITVRPRRKGVPPGSYQIRIEEVRAATEADRELH